MFFYFPFMAYMLSTGNSFIVFQNKLAAEDYIGEDGIYDMTEVIVL